LVKKIGSENEDGLKLYWHTTKQLVKKEDLGKPIMAAMLGMKANYSLEGQ